MTFRTCANMASQFLAAIAILLLLTSCSSYARERDAIDRAAMRSEAKIKASVH